MKNAIWYEQWETSEDIECVLYGYKNTINRNGIINARKADSMYLKSYKNERKEGIHYFGNAIPWHRQVWQLAKDFGLDPNRITQIIHIASFSDDPYRKAWQMIFDTI